MLMHFSLFRLVCAGLEYLHGPGHCRTLDQKSLGTDGQLYLGYIFCYNHLEIEEIASSSYLQGVAWWKSTLDNDATRSLGGSTTRYAWSKIDI